MNLKEFIDIIISCVIACTVCELRHQKEITAKEYVSNPSEYIVDSIVTIHGSAMNVEYNVIKK